MQEQTVTHTYRVIALAASAGGLDALGRLLSGLPADLPVPVLIVQHIARDRATRTPEILDRRTALHVRLAEEGESIEPGFAYVAAPDRHLLVRPDSTLTLADTARVRYSRPSADALFRSCAESYGAGVIAVVLSGSGRDAADGAVAVQDAGGIVIVQDPHTAAFASMPQATISLDHPDYILALDEIARKLLTLLGQESNSKARQTPR
jgi:two-component system, chemotaxis family, protein-glutamate methylesterase/glutaminase